MNGDGVRPNRELHRPKPCRAAGQFELKCPEAHNRGQIALGHYLPSTRLASPMKSATNRIVRLLIEFARGACLGDARGWTSNDASEMASASS